MMTDRQNRWLVFCLIWGLAIIVLVLAAVLVAPPQAHGQNHTFMDLPCSTASCPSCPPVGSQTTPPWAGVGIFGPSGGWAGARAAPGRGVQAGVGGPRGGVVGAQVGPGPRVQAGVIPGGGRYVTETVDPSAGLVASNRTRPAVVWVQCVKLTPNAPKQPIPGGGFQQALSENDCGSGVILKSDTPGEAIVLTAAHVHRGRHDYYQVSGPGVVGTRRARLFKSDAEQDVAAFAINEGDLSYVAMGRDPAIGDPIIVCGYGPGAYRESPGRVVKAVSGGRWLVADCHDITEGDSGGPVLDRNGRLVGILWGGSGGHFTPISIIQRWFGVPVTSPPRATMEYVPPPLSGPVDSGAASRPTDPYQIDPDTGDRLPPRPVVAVTRDEFTAAMDSIRERDQEIVDRLMIHSEAIADHETRIVELEQPRLVCPTPEVTREDLAAVNDRVAALEAADRGPLFYSETYIDGKLVEQLPVHRGQAVKYRSKLMPGAPTDSFRVDVEPPGDTQ